jgi:hypothetical protein
VGGVGETSMEDIEKLEPFVASMSPHHKTMLSTQNHYILAEA